MANGRRTKGTGILAFVFLLPLVAIIIFAIKYSSQNIVLNNVSRVTVAAPDRERVSYDSEEDIGFFVDMLKSSLSINSQMRDVSGETPVRIIFEREDKSLEYVFYPSLNLSGCLLVAPDEKLYVLENETAKQLLLRPEFAYLYSAYFLPKLNVVSGTFSTEVKPVESSWTYYKSDGEAYNYTPTEYAGEDDVCTIYKGLNNALVFDLLPEGDSGPEIVDMTCVADNGDEYNIREISALNFSTDRMLTVSFTAKWSSLNSARAFGEAKYSIRLRYDIPATLESFGGDYQLGDVVEVDATHLNPDEVITFDSLLDIPRVEFGMTSEERGTGVALLPIGLSNAAGEHTVTLNWGGNSMTEILNIQGEPAIGIDKFVSVPIEIYEERFTPEAIQAFREEIAKATEARPKVDHFVYGESEFESPLDSAKPVVGFGKKVNISAVGNESSDSGNRISDGLIYEVADLSNVRAVQAGEVVLSGYYGPTGNTVVLYHGYGIYSYYYHLNDIEDIGVGRVYNQNDTISFTGTSYEGSQQHVLNFAMSIDGVFVNPQWFTEVYNSQVD